MSLLGVDVGQTGCKAAAFSEDGEQVASAYREYPTIHRQPDWAELDCVHVWDCVKQCIREVAVRTAADPVTAVGASSMGEAMVPVTRDREILGSCILFSDARGAEYIEALRREISQEDFYRINPNILGPSYSLPKLRWMKDHAPDLYERTDCFIPAGDFVTFMLGAEPSTSCSLANRTLLLDIRREDWSDEILRLSGLEREKLPRVVPDGTVIGEVSAAAAEELGLPRGARIVVAGHDQCCNALGAGVIHAGEAVCGIGTFECLTPTYDHIPDDVETMLKYGLNVEHHVVPGLYASFIFNQSGMLVKWFRDTFAAADGARMKDGEDLYDALSAEMPEDPTRLFVLPYFDITGPPEFVADGKGAIVGLKSSTQRGEILKAIMESVTLYFVESVHAMGAMGIDTSEFVATGGGAKSDPWLQIKADIFGVPFIRPRITECTVLGAAMRAGISTGSFRDPAEAVERFVARDRVFHPDPTRHAAYQERLEVYRKLWPLMGGFLREM